MNEHRQSALILAGHGSTVNAESSLPTFQHADAIREKKIFAEVHVAFWKEEPNFRQALNQVEMEKIYIVPNFISSGYFTEEVIPREFNLSGPVTQKGRTRIFYCEPVGLHSFMTEALLKKAEQVVRDSNRPLQNRESTCLFICGHGTSLNDNSTKVIYEQVEEIKKRNLFADCQAVFMEQTPLVQNWKTLTSCKEVIVVPFFISDGLHSFEDIPQLLGISSKKTEMPQKIEERWLWYSNAIGTDPFMTEVILAQVKKIDETYGSSPTLA